LYATLGQRKTKDIGGTTNDLPERLSIRGEKEIQIIRAKKKCQDAEGKNSLKEYGLRLWLARLSEILGPQRNSYKGVRRFAAEKGMQLQGRRQARIEEKKKMGNSSDCR